ncbi:MAG: DinB family protein [Bacteroidota bacterium]
MATLSTIPTAAVPATFLDHKAIAEGWRDTFSAEQLNWKPSPKRWSVAECIQHLNRTTGIYVPALKARLAQGDLPPGQPPFTYGWFARFTVRSFGPDSSMKLKAPGVFEPRSEGGPTASGFDPQALVGEFADLQDQFVALFDAAEGLDLSKGKMASPAARIFKMPVGAWFEAMAAHQARHLAQAQRVMAEPGFPR